MRKPALAVALLFVSATLSAQNIGPLPPLTAHVDVQVINVDVTVTDRNGKPVMNLTKDDFELFEDGVKQKISNFYIVENAAPRDEKTARADAATAGEAPAEFRRKVLLLIDNNYIEKAERNIALTKIEDYVAKAFGAEWAVAAIGQGADLVQPFTSDTASIRRAFQRVRALPTFYSQQQIDRSILSDRTRKHMDMQENTNYDYAQTVAFAGREQTFRALMTVQNTTRAVTEMARAHSADIGKKYIILLTGGMEANTTFAAYEKGNDRELRQLRLDIAKLIDGMVREANAANFTVHVINARTRGMQAPQHDVENKSSGLNVTNLLRSNVGNEPVDTSNVDSAPLSLALGTGGSYFPSTDVVASVRTVEHHTANYYSLGYSPKHQGDRQYHRIRVNVKRPGVRVANRVGYYDLTAEDRLQEMLRARSTFDRPVGSLPVKITVGKPLSRADDLVVPVTAAISMNNVTLLPHDQGFAGRVHVYLSVFDRDGRNVAFEHQTQEVTISPDRIETAADGMFRYTVKVHLKKGKDFTVIMTLRDELSNEIGSAVEAVTL
jgi:VWFA-related protein